MVMNNLIKEINQGEGFISLTKVESSILDLINKAIENTLKELLNSNQIFKNNSESCIFDSYKFIPNKDWISLFNKKSRALNREMSQPLSNYFKNYLEDIFKCKVEIRDLLLLGYPSLSFRIVRPMQPSDVGAMHADQWFIDIGETRDEKTRGNYQLLKFWLPINVESFSSNLLLIPKSQNNLKKFEYDLLKTQNGIKPVIKKNFKNEDIYMIENKNGFPIVFHMNLIHGGALNRSKDCRISLEFEFSLFK